jgi:autotransporter-associated beta strand protein
MIEQRPSFERGNQTLGCDSNKKQLIMKKTPRPTPLDHSIFKKPCSVSTLFAVLLYGSCAQAASLYWDTNSTTAGSGAATGTWSINNFWNTDPTGGAGGAFQTATTNADDLFFSAGTNGSTGTVTISGAQAANSITFQNNVAISLGGGTSLTLGGGGGSGTGITVALGDNAANTISTAVILGASSSAESFTNNGTGLLTVGAITGAATAGTQTLTLSSANAGGIALNGIIGNGAAGGNVALVVNNTGAGITTLSGANTFTGGLTIASGTVLASGNSKELGGNGTGVVTLGGATGSANATLLIDSGLTVANPITVQAGSSGNTLTIGENGSVSATASGNITLNNNLTVTVNGFAVATNAGPMLTLSGTIGGTGNLALNVASNMSTSNNAKNPVQPSVNVTGAVTTSGTITNSGSGEGFAQIAGNISNAAAVIQNSATSMLQLGGSNTYTGATLVNAGVLSINSNNAILNTAVTVASGATLDLAVNGGSILTGQTVTISGKGTSYTAGALESVQANAGTLGLSIVMAADSTIASNGNVFSPLTLSGTISGVGKTLTTVGTNNMTISGAIVTGTGGLVKAGQNTLTLSGSNSFTGVTAINSGIVNLNSANALAGGGYITFGGGTLQFSNNNTTDYASRIVNSKGSIAIDTNGKNITFSSGFAASNTAGLTKLGGGTMTLAGTNLYTGITAINGGNLTISSASALPSSSVVFIDVAGGLNSGGGLC